VRSFQVVREARTREDRVSFWSSRSRMVPIKRRISDGKICLGVRLVDIVGGFAISDSRRL